MNQTEFVLDPANGPHKRSDAEMAELNVQVAVMRTIESHVPASMSTQDAEDFVLSVLLSMLCSNARVLGIPFERVISNVLNAYVHYAPKDPVSDATVDPTL